MWKGRAWIILLLLSCLVTHEASAGIFCWWGSLGKDKKAETEVPKVEEVVPPMIQDGPKLVELRRIKKEQGKEAYDKAYKKYDPAAVYGKFQKYLWGPVAWALGGAMAAHTLWHLGHEPSRFPVAAAVVGMAYYLADAFSAVIHKTIDSFLSETSPIWGRNVREFRIHHENPKNGIDIPYLERVVEPGRLTSVFLAGTAILSAKGWIPPELQAGLVTFLMANMNGPSIHTQSHREKVGRLWGMLQKLGLVLSKETHNKHHAPPFDTDYGVVNGWSNGLFRVLNLWQHLDNISWKYFRRMPNNWIQDPRSIPPHVLEGLKKDFDSIPPELWGYSSTAYPARIPAGLQPLVPKVEANWRKRFIEMRRALYREQAAASPEERAKAERQWLDEQKEFEWAYGPSSSLPLFAEGR